MTIHFDIPAEVETTLRQHHADLNQAARELFLVELYRRGVLTHHQLATALGLSRYETDGVLKRHGVAYDTTREELDHQLESLRPGSSA